MDFSECLMDCFALHLFRLLWIVKPEDVHKRKEELMTLNTIIIISILSKWLTLICNIYLRSISFFLIYIVTYIPDWLPLINCSNSFVGKASNTYNDEHSESVREKETNTANEKNKIVLFSKLVIHVRLFFFFFKRKHTQI